MRTEGGRWSSRWTSTADRIGADHWFCMDNPSSAVPTYLIAADPDVHPAGAAA